jgi:hypothetical protein
LLSVLIVGIFYRLLIKEAEEPDGDRLLSGEVTTLKDIVAVTTIATRKLLLDLEGIVPINLKES